MAALLSESEFIALANTALDAIEVQADAWGEADLADVDVARSGNVVTLAFDSGVQVVVNSQVPMRELWLAHPQGGYHYRLIEGRWQDTRGGVDLPEALASACSAAAGTSLTLDVPVRVQGR